MLISLTVGKVDAGVAVLLTQDKRLVSYALNNDSINSTLTTYVQLGHCTCYFPRPPELTIPLTD